MADEKDEPAEVGATSPPHADSRALEASSARAKWDRCRAWARSAGRPCEAEGAGMGGRCALHGGLVVGGNWNPQPVWEIRVAPSGYWVSPNRAPRTWRRPVWPRRVRPWVAVRLVARAQVTRALLHRGEGMWFLRELQRCGVRVVTECGDALVRRVTFEVADPEASRLAAKRRGRG